MTTESSAAHLRQDFHLRQGYGGQDGGQAATTSSDRWERLSLLFEGALALPPADREDYLRVHCSDPGVAVEIKALLAAQVAEAGPVERVMAALGSPIENRWRDPAPRSQVGPYELLREIGHGGMGVVYLARRADGVYQRLVALKLARAPVLDATLRDRFLAERDILAGLAHPNIATLFDGGVTDDGLPYFTMEYVDGKPIDAYCDANRLNLRARIQLFLHTCGAVAAAHRALVVHRDLKPTNVLVTESGEVKLLDFGIAKLLAMESPDRRTETATDTRVMTPAYASPEQVMGAAVSTATDVYALGLLLYELLCGRRAHRLESRGAPHLEQVVVQGDPLPMADALTRPGPGGDGASAEAIAQARQTTPARLARQLRGDLARIAEMALRKDPDRRYATAAHLAEDLERHLDGRPVLARPHSLVYRASRFARRHRVALAAAAIVVAALVGYTALNVRHAREMERRLDDLRKLARTMLFDVHDRIATLPGSTEARHTLVRETLRYLDRLSKEGRVEQSIALELAEAYVRVGQVQFNLNTSNLGDAEGALASYRTARGILTEHLVLSGPTPTLERLIARTYGSEADVQMYQQKHSDARASITEALKIRERLAANGLPEDQRGLGSGYFQLGSALHGIDLQASLDAKRRALTIFDALLAAAPTDPEAQRNVALACKSLGATLNDLRQYDEVERLYRRALALDEARLAADPDSATTRMDVSFDLSSLASLLANLRRPEAVDYWERTIEIRRALADADPKDMRARGRLAFALKGSGSTRMRFADYARALDDLQAAVTPIDALLSVNPNDRLALSYAAETFHNIGISEQQLIRRDTSSAEASARRRRACESLERAETYYTRYGEPLTKKTQADAEAARRGLMECRLEQK
jgi:serine/threonine protein kinase